MKSGSWKDYAEPVGIAAVVASLIFVGLEVRQTQDIAISEYEASILQNSVDISNAINQHPLIWEKGRSGAELNPDETVLFENLVKLHLHRAFFTRAQMLRIGHSGAETPVHEFAALLHQYPGVRREWERQMNDMETNRKPLGFVGFLGGDFADSLNRDLAILEGQKD